MRPAEKSRSHGGISGRKGHNLTMIGGDVYAALRLSAPGALDLEHCAGEMTPGRSVIGQINTCIINVT